MSLLLVNGNSPHIPLADKSVHCIVTSPPYYSLRDYGTAEWIGGDSACDHLQAATGGNAKQGKNKGNNGEYGQPYKTTCKKCGAQRVDHQIGLEASPEAYIANMVAVFRECWRVLRDDGVMFLNIGDSYAGSGGAGGDYAEGGLKEGQPRYEGTSRQMKIDKSKRNSKRWGGGNIPSTGDLKPKDLIGIPWMLAFALRADGWYLRQDIIWHKPNPMPESVTDRCTKSHEYLFLLSKSARYYYDNDAIREANGEQPTWDEYNAARIPFTDHAADSEMGMHQSHPEGFKAMTHPLGRNRRSVWTIPTSPYSGAHFATYPPKLVEPCIKAGTSERGCCPKCGAPWERVTEVKYLSKIILTGTEQGRMEKGRNRNVTRMGDGKEVNTLDWQPSCHCDAGAPRPCIVFDPFAGSGTTLQVARSLGRHAVGLDLSFRYLQECACTRLGLAAWDAWTRGIPANGSIVSDLPLFSGGNV